MIYQTTDGGFHAVFQKPYTPGYFPGYFKLCARNTNTVPAQVQMSIWGYQAAQKPGPAW